VDLSKYRDAQMATHANALAELERGEKQTHWMWWTFPTLPMPHMSPTSLHYALESVEEAQAFLNDSVLRDNLDILTAVVVRLSDRRLVDIFGEIDVVKFRACMGLFYGLTRGEPLYREGMMKI
jgi:uncharacterized protein (DUF1810 family)